ncbi:MAG: hypothetical protein WC028_24985 [Candidatus Obscuribacterales bacterium]
MYRNQIRLVPALVCLLALSVTVQTYFAPANCAPLKSQGQKQSSAISPKRFERLRKASDPWAVLQDPEVKASVHALMGNLDEEYWGRTQLLDDSYSRGDDLLIAGDVRGLAGSMVSLFYLNYSTGKLYVGYNDGTEIHLFGLKSKNDVPQVMNEYAKKNLAGKPIVFEVADWKPLKKTKGKTATAVPLNLAKLTGTYERKDGRFIYSTMLVEQLPGSQIKFQINANNGGNSGQAAGTISLKEQRGTYKQDGGEIELKFSGGKVVVCGNDSYFCGNAVTLLGTYVKTSDQSPRFDND